MKQVLVNSLFNSGKQVAAVVIAFVVSPIIVHSLGNEGYGFWSLIISITGYYSFLELGVTTAVVKYVSHYFAQGDAKRVRSVCTTASLFFAAVSVVVLVASFTVGLMFNRWFDVAEEVAPSLLLIVVVLGANMALNLLFSGVAATLFAFQEIPPLSTVEIITNVVKNLLIVVLLARGHGLVMMAFVTLATSVLRVILLWLVLRRRHPEVQVDKAAYDTEMLRTIFSYSWASVVITSASKVVYFSNPIIIGRAIKVTEVTFYSIAASLLVYVEQFVWSILQVLIPVISGYDATGNVAGNRRLYILGTRYSIVLSLPVLVTLFAVGDVFIGNWMGDEYAVKCGRVLRILVVGYAFHMSKFVAEAILKGINRHRVLAVVLLTQALIGIALSILLAEDWGIDGVAFGAVVPMVVGNAFVVPIYTCRVLGMSFRRFLQQALMAPAALVVIFVVLHRLLAPKVTTYLDIILYAGGALAFFAILGWFLVVEEGHRRKIALYLVDRERWKSRGS